MLSRTLFATLFLGSTLAAAQVQAVAEKTSPSTTTTLPLKVKPRAAKKTEAPTTTTTTAPPAPATAAKSAEPKADSKDDGKDDEENQPSNDDNVEVQQYVAPTIPLPPRTIIAKLVANGAPRRGVEHLYNYLARYEGHEVIEHTYECVGRPGSVKACPNHERIPSTQKITVRVHPYSVYVDFTKPSNVKRFYVLNWTTGHVTKYLTTHGRGSGKLYAYKFGNKENSLKTSLGMYVTGNSYPGTHGPSLRMYGLNASNNQAYIRDIVIHPAWYASEHFMDETNPKTGEPFHRLGVSWGCPALAPADAVRLIPLLRGGALIFHDHAQLLGAAMSGQDVTGPDPEAAQPPKPPKPPEIKPTATVINKEEPKADGAAKSEKKSDVAPAVTPQAGSEHKALPSAPSKAAQDAVRLAPHKEPVQEGDGEDSPDGSKNSSQGDDEH